MLPTDIVNRARRLWEYHSTTSRSDDFMRSCALVYLAAREWRSRYKE